MRTSILLAGIYISSAVNNGQWYSDSTRLFLAFMLSIFFVMDMFEFFNKIFRNK